MVGSLTIPKTTVVVEEYLHDTGGLAIFEEWAPKYWNDINAVLLVYDITRQETFQALNKWIDLLKTHRFGRALDVCFFLDQK